MAKTVIQTKVISRRDLNEFNDDLNAFLTNIDHENLVDIKYQQQYTDSAFSALVLYRTKK
jgi:Sporulation protein Cse60